MRRTGKGHVGHSACHAIMGPVISDHHIEIVKIPGLSKGAGNLNPFGQIDPAFVAVISAEPQAQDKNPSLLRREPSLALPAQTACGFQGFHHSCRCAGW